MLTWFDLQECIIADCGEVPPGEDISSIGVVDDGTGDLYDDYPEDTDLDFSQVPDTPYFNKIS
jgi:hypothetical protein